MMLSNISMTCFAASYAVTFSLEMSRLFLQLPVRWFVMIGFAAAGWFAHTVYLVLRARDGLDTGSSAPLSSWYDWCLLVAWVVVGVYLGLAVRRPRNTLGVFLLPLVLGLIGAAYLARNVPPFAREDAVSGWGVLHGVLLLLGTVTAALGFTSGVMYLVQARRLKKKLLGRSRLQLPSLEWLHQICRRSVVLSSALFGLGLMAGAILNVIRQSHAQATMGWSHPVVISSAVFFAWLLATAVIEYVYRPASAGHRVAVLTLASFVFLTLVLTLVLLDRHGSPRSSVIDTSLITLLGRIESDGQSYGEA